MGEKNRLNITKFRSVTQMVPLMLRLFAYLGIYNNHGNASAFHVLLDFLCLVMQTPAKELKMLLLEYLGRFDHPRTRPS